MHTKYLQISPAATSAELRDQLAEAAAIIRGGGLVAFPTETVYGLGANALDPLAVKKIFAAKQRPADNPVIIHIAEVTELAKYAVRIPEKAWELATAFWPGPLTLVLPKAEIIPLEVTAGSQTVTVRLPANPIARTLIELAGVPIAAPSANTSGRPSPTIAQHVLHDLDGQVDLIIDGGPTEVGVESTVLDLVLEPPTILRPGQVTFEQLEPYLPDLQTLSALGDSTGISLLTNSTRPVRSPGLKYKHYSPSSTVILIHANSTAEFEHKVQELLEIAASKNQAVGILSLDELTHQFSPHQVSANTPATYAHILFDTFRQFEMHQVQLILAQAIPTAGVGRAVMDRLTRAADEEVWV